MSPVRIPRLLLLCCLLLAACAQRAPRQQAYASLEIINATLYQQTAAEYRALTRQVFAQAQARLDLELADRSRTAALEQEAPFEHKPPAVIVDIDETMLDNAPYEARLIDSGEVFVQDNWGKWVQEAAAREIPGALDFARACAARGVQVIYISNRLTSEAEITRRNLERLGFPFATDLSHLLFRPENREDPLYPKGARRARVAQDYRIIALVGDNLGDFTEQFRSPVAQRFAAVEEHAARWGTQWFMLPNAMYGSWDDALTDFERDLDDTERFERKRKWLDRRGLGPLPDAASQ